MDEKNEDMASASPTVLYISTYYSPTTGAAGIRAVRFVEGLRCRGYRVIVLTSGKQPELTAAADGVLCRVREDGQIPEALGCKSAKRWDRQNALPGPDPEPRRIEGFFRCGQLLIETYHPSILIASGPPFSCAAMAHELGAMYRIAVLQDFRDAWFTGMPWPYPSRRLRNRSEHWEQICLADAAAVTVVTQTLGRLLEERYGAEPGKKIVYIPHSFETPKSGAGSSSPIPRTENEFRIVYTGQLRGVRETAMSPLHRSFRRLGQQFRRLAFGANFCEKLRLEWMSPHILLEAMGTVAADHPDFARDLRFLLAGESFSAIDRWAGQFGIRRNILQTGPLPPEQARLLPHSADLLVLSLYGIQDCPHHWCVPSKVFEYLGTGKPILSLTPPGEASDIVRLAGTGLPVHPEDKARIADLLLQLYRQHQAGGIAIRPDWNYIRRFHLPNQQKQFCDLVDSLCHPNPVVPERERAECVA